MYLAIDLTKKDIIHVILFDESLLVEKEVPGRNRDALVIIDELLREQQLTTRDVQGIMVVLGAGSFTSTRIGTIIANTFAYVFHIPVLPIQVENLSHLVAQISRFQSELHHSLLPTYSAPPSIG